MVKAWAPDDFPPGYLLPKLGVITFDELGTALCFLCADMSNNVPRAFLDHLQTNPDIPPVTRYKAVKMAEEFICRELKRLGYNVVNCVTRHVGVATISQSLGYHVNPKALIHLQKVI